MKESNRFDYKRVNALYKEAFPKEERIPLPILAIATMRKGVEIAEYFDGNIFVGFTYSVRNENMIFLMFFAVPSELRQQGYGSKILSYLKERNPNKVIVLNVEPLDEGADNYVQRVNRVKFYNKNGIHDTGYSASDVGGTFRVFATEKTLDKQNYTELCKHVSFGFWNGGLRKDK